ncbi:MAG: hypothetical protein Q4G64_05760 [bacterium]|nr:hypothetical protein [bacterium]
MSTPHESDEFGESRELDGLQEPLELEEDLPELPDSESEPGEGSTFRRGMVDRDTRKIWRFPLLVAFLGLVVVSMTVQIVMDATSGETPDQPLWLMVLALLFFACLLFLAIYGFWASSTYRSAERKRRRIVTVGRRRWSDLTYAIAPWGIALAAMVTVGATFNLFVSTALEYYGISPVVPWSLLAVGLLALALLVPPYLKQREIHAAEQRGESYVDYPGATAVGYEPASFAEPVSTEDRAAATSLPDRTAATSLPDHATGTSLPDVTASEADDGEGSAPVRTTRRKRKVQWSFPLVVALVMVVLLFTLPVVISIYEGAPWWEAVLWVLLPLGLVALWMWFGLRMASRERKKKRAEGYYESRDEERPRRDQVPTEAPHQPE